MWVNSSESLESGEFADTHYQLSPVEKVLRLSVGAKADGLHLLALQLQAAGVAVQEHSCSRRVFG